MSDIVNSSNKCILRFPDKSSWNEFKEDLKVTLKDNNIKFQYSEKTPLFHILYKSDDIKIKVTWEDESLLFSLETVPTIDSNNLNVCKEIYDLLILFSGELVDGTSPYHW